LFTLEWTHPEVCLYHARKVSSNGRELS